MFAKTVFAFKITNSENTIARTPFKLSLFSAQSGSASENSFFIEAITGTESAISDKRIVTVNVFVIFALFNALLRSRMQKIIKPAPNK